MGSRAAELVAGIIDRIEDRPFGTGRPPLPTIKVVEALRFFVREGVQWRELRATAGRACGSTQGSRMRNQKLIYMGSLNAVSPHRRSEERPLRNRGASLPSGLSHRSDLMREPCGSTLRRRLDDWSATAVLRRVHVALVRMVRAGPELAPWDVVVDSCSVRAKRGGELTGPNPTDRGRLLVPAAPRWPSFPRPPTSMTRGSSRICCAWPRSSAPPSASYMRTPPTTAPRTADFVCGTTSSPASARRASRMDRGSARSAALSSTVAPGCSPTSDWTGARIGSAA
jgi:hypothetical protein